MFLFLFRSDIQLNERTSAFIHYTLKAKKVKNKKLLFHIIDFHGMYFYLVHFTCNILLGF